MNFREMQIESTSELLSKIIKEYILNNDSELKNLIFTEFGKMREFFEKDGQEQFKKELWNNPISIITNDILKRYNNQLKAVDTKDILVVDYNYLFPEYKDKNTEEIKADLESEYGCKIFIVDSSIQNICGVMAVNSPIYFLRNEEKFPLKRMDPSPKTTEKIKKLIKLDN